MTERRHTYIYGGIMIRMFIDFVWEIIQNKRQCNEIFKVQKEKEKKVFQNKIICLTKLLFKNKNMFRKTKAEIIYHQHSHTMRNAKGKFFRLKGNETHGKE